MIITFSKEFVASPSHADIEAYVIDIIEGISVMNYPLRWRVRLGNLVPSITWVRGRRVRFTIETRDAYKHG